MKFTLRLKNNNVFRYVLKKGKYSKNGKYITVHFLSTKKNDNKNVFGVCVSKKNGNSVVRNKLKRWAREAYKIEEVKLKRGINLVILYKKFVNIEVTNFSLIYDDFCACLKELGLYDT